VDQSFPELIALYIHFLQAKYGFVAFSDPEDFLKAWKEMDGKPLEYTARLMLSD